MRIVGGKYKRTLLPVDDRPGLRPTPERVRETVFDWLGHLLGGLAGRTVLDMFAGTGALGLEAVSRGAARAVLVEADRRGAAALSAVAARLGEAGNVQVVCADALRWLAGSGDVFDVVFIDPPFAADLHRQAAELAKAHLAPGGLIYLESDREFDDAWLAGLGLEAVRRSRAGAVFFLLAEPRNTLQ